MRIVGDDPAVHVQPLKSNLVIWTLLTITKLVKTLVNFRHEFFMHAKYNAIIM